jgi:glycerol-1-phosphate dehydrogenase [NAD(P)+]
LSDNVFASVSTVDDAEPGHALSRPTRDALLIGHGVLADALAELPAGYVLISQPGPLEHAPPICTARARTVLHAVSLERSRLERLSADWPGAPAIVGIGGGVVMDSAKWLAHATGAPLVLAPSIVSADACVTNSIAVRDGGRVVYTGFVEAQRVVVDVDLVRRAPARLNRAGVGDLLSIHTALWDWSAGERAGRGTVDVGIARRAAEVLDSVDRIADGLRDVSDQALRAIMAGYAEINDMTMALGHPQMEEGSEHYLGYLIEHQTGRSFVHGELVTLGVLLMSSLQGNDTARARSIADRCGVLWRPEDLGLSAEVLSRALLALHAYVRESGFAHSVADERPLDREDVGRLLAEVS